MVKQQDTPAPPMVLAFADNGTSQNRSRVRLPGEQDRAGLVIEQGPLLAGGDPYKPLLLIDAGGATAGALINQVHLIAVNNSRYSHQPLSLEIYLLQSPDKVEVENTGEGQVTVTWEAPPLPAGVISKYRLYPQLEGADPRFAMEVDSSETSLKFDAQELTDGADGVKLFMRSVDKYHYESPDSELLDVPEQGLVCRTNHYPTGELQSESCFLKGEEHVLSKLYFKSGQLRTELPFDEGRLDGVKIEY